MSGAVPKPVYTRSGTSPETGARLIVETLRILFIERAQSAVELTGGLAMNAPALDALATDPEAHQAVWTMIADCSAELGATDQPHAQAAGAIGWLFAACESEAELEAAKTAPPVARALEALKTAGHEAALKPLRKLYLDQSAALRAANRP